MHNVSFSSKNNLISKKMVQLKEGLNFKDFSRPNKQIKYFSRTITEFKDFSRQLLKFKTFSRLYEPYVLWTCDKKQKAVIMY